MSHLQAFFSYPTQSDFFLLCAFSNNFNVDCSCDLLIDLYAAFEGAGFLDFGNGDILLIDLDTGGGEGFCHHPGQCQDAALDAEISPLAILQARRRQAL